MSEKLNKHELNELKLNTISASVLCDYYDMPKINFPFRVSFQVV
jgi:hypothetical protein